MIIVQRLVTSPTKGEFLAAFYDSWHYSQGRSSKLAAAILYAQFAFETGRGKYCYNWNLGNLRKGGWTGNVFELPTAWEIVNGKRVVVGGYFRAFLSLSEGMDHHLYFLSTLYRYARAFAVLVEASITACDKPAILRLARLFVIELKKGGYFTGDEEEYARGVTSIALEFLGIDINAPEPGQRGVPLDADREFAGWGATTVQDVFGRWAYDEEHTADFLACRYDCEGEKHYGA